jgi:hypothetical protein
MGMTSCTLIIAAVFAQFFKVLRRISFSLGNEGKAVHKVDFWHSRQQSSRSELNSFLLNKPIFVKVLSTSSGILRVSFSTPRYRARDLPVRTDPSNR